MAKLMKNALAVLLSACMVFTFVPLAWADIELFDDSDGEDAAGIEQGAATDEGSQQYSSDYQEQVAQQEGQSFSLARLSLSTEDQVYAELDGRAAASLDAIEDGTYFVSTSLDGVRVLDVAGASKSSGANVALWSPNMGANQRWAVSHDEDGYVTFTNVCSGKVLEVAGGTAKSGANVQQGTADGSRGQKWIVEEGASGGYTVSSALWTGLVLDVSGAKSKDGANVIVWEPNGGSNQLWLFESLEQVYAELDGRAAASLDAIEDGTYFVSTSLDGVRVLDVAGASKSSGANVALWSPNMGANQRWAVSHDEDGYVTFTNVCSGKVLEVAGGTAKSGANVQQGTADGSRGQKWIVEEGASGGYTVSSALWTGLSLDVNEGKPKDGANIQIYASNDTAAQDFVFFDANPVVDSSPRVAELESGYYKIKAQGNTSYCLDVLGASTAGGANVQIYSDNGSYAQLYTLKFVGDNATSEGYYQVICCCSDMAVAVYKGVVADGANVVQVTADAEDDSQLFSIRRNEDGSYTFVNKASGLALDVLNSTYANGSNIQGYTPNGSTAQSFVFEEVVDLLKEGCVSISPKPKSSMRVDVSGASLTDGANVLLYTNNDAFNQKWLLTLLGDGTNTYTVQSINSGMNLTVDPDGNVVQRIPDESDKQKWQPEISKGAVVLRNVGTGLVLEVANSSMSNNANVQAAEADGSSGQLFAFKSVDLVTRSTYYIAPLSSASTPLDLPRCSSVNGTKIQIYSKNDSGAQKWKVSKNSDGTYSIKNAATGGALELSGSAVQINTANESTSQKWVFTYCTGGGIKITSAANPDVALTVAGSGFASGTSVEGAMDDGLDSQKFVFTKTLHVPSNVQSNFRDMYIKAYNYSSNTDWLIMVDRSRCILGVFRGNQDEWTLVKQLSCAVGKISSPTPTGVSVTTKRYYYHSQSYYRTVFWYGQYGIHSVVSSDSELGKWVSNGCVRISRNEAIWVFNNVALGTTVVVY